MANKNSNRDDLDWFLQQQPQKGSSKGSLMASVGMAAGAIAVGLGAWAAWRAWRKSRAPLRWIKTHRYCLLHAGEPPGTLAQKHGDYDAMFVDLFGPCGHPTDSSSESWDIIAYHKGAVLRESDIEKYDGFVITGSANSAYDDEQWIHNLKSIIRVIYRKRRKLVGICFGHQIIAEALGGQVVKAAGGWELGARRIELTESFKKYFPDSRLKSKFWIVESHQDQVVKLPRDAVVLGSSENCPIEMYQMPRQHPRVLCLQGHPEFEASFAHNLYAEIAARGRASQALTKAAQESLPVSMGSVAPRSLRFLLVEFLKTSID